MTEPICDDLLIILTKDGVIKKELSFAKMIAQNNTFINAIDSTKNKEFHNFGLDIFHTNTLEIIDKDMNYETKKLFKKGIMVISIQNKLIIFKVGILNERYFRRRT